MNTMLDVIGKVLVLGLARPLQTRMRRSAPLLAFFTPSKLLCGNHGLSRLIYSTYPTHPGMTMAWMAPRPRPLSPAGGIQSAVWTCKCAPHFRVGIRKELNNRFAGFSLCHHISEESVSMVRKTSMVTYSLSILPQYIPLYIMD